MGKYAAAGVPNGVPAPATAMCAWKVGECLCQLIDMPGRQLAARQHAVELRTLRELAHLDHVFERRAGAVQLGAGGEPVTAITSR